MRPSSLAMASGPRTKSTHPAAIALRGIELYRAEASWAKVSPPSALMASSPSVPSLAVPDRITPIARSFWSSASDSKKASMTLRGSRARLRCRSFSVPPAMLRVMLGGMT